MVRLSLDASLDASLEVSQAELTKGPARGGALCFNPEPLPSLTGWELTDLKITPALADIDRARAAAREVKGFVDPVTPGTPGIEGKNASNPTRITSQDVDVKSGGFTNASHPGRGAPVTKPESAQRLGVQGGALPFRPNGCGSTNARIITVV
ncbi:MAG: hypothetical protein IT384_07460 [Deltaproteobacteria bacterium]|nr:hypothetical protein [Deltaproteobacteria bacterium]